MLRVALGAMGIATAVFLGGCASSPGVRQAKQNDPIIVVTVQSSQKNVAANPVPVKKDELERAAKEAEIVSILGAMKGNPSVELDEPGGIIGGVPGGVLGGVPIGVIGTGSYGSGGLGLSGVGLGGGGGGFGSIGTIGHGTGSAYGSGGSGMIGLIGRAPSERVKAKFGSLSVTGPLMLDVVQRHIDDRREDIENCHHYESSHSGNRWGSVTLRLHIDAQGHVDEVRVVESTLASQELDSCIAHAVGSFEFPTPSSNASVSVTLPISF